jgi:hypothetical protein
LNVFEKKRIGIFVYFLQYCKETLKYFQFQIIWVNILREVLDNFKLQVFYLFIHVNVQRRIYSYNSQVAEISWGFLRRRSSVVQYISPACTHGLINYIDTKAKCHLKINL